MTIATPKSYVIDSCVNKHKTFWHETAITYTLIGYLLGVALLFMSSIWVNIIGTVFLTHSLVYSAYLSHEFMHGTIFKARRHNVIFGQLMLWINGGCYYGLQALTLQHIAHHLDRADVYTFDIPAAIKKLPTWTRRVIFALEWCYFPIVAFWSRWQSIISNWQKYEHRKRITLIFAIRFTTFALLGIFTPKVLLLYFLAYVGMITVLRFVDAFQHTYESYLDKTSLPKRDRNHEQLHTYSNLISYKYPWLNLLILNFCYHNAHHTIMTYPWHSLPELNLKLAENQEINYISFSQQLANYHTYRLTRLTAGQGDVSGSMSNRNYTQFYGAVDVSFITLY